MKEKMRVAIAGAGMVTRHHLIAWSRLSEVEVTAICNRKPEKVLSRTREFNIPKAYSNLVEMLEKEKPDALDIASMARLESQIAQKVGKPVFSSPRLCVERVKNMLERL